MRKFLLGGAGPSPLTDLRAAPRTLDFHLLRACERLHLNESDFLALPYAEQLRLLAYHHLRSLEESPP